MGKRSIRRRAITAGAIVLAVAGSVFGSVAPAQAYTGIDPYTSGCSADAYTVASWGAYNSKYGQYQGSIELRASPQCGTNWLRISSTVYGNRVFGGIQVLPGGASTGRAAYDVGSTYTDMVYAPGHTCVNVYAYIIDNATNEAEGHLPNQTVC